jgi:two-component system alkaline phosphatase synthesis response regulator PhoP
VSPLGPSISLLLVEDETSLGTVLKERLGQEGYQVIWEISAEDALHFVKSQPVGMALIDIHLPGQDGFWLATQLRRSHPEVGVIFLTAYGSPDFRVRGFELGACDYIIKPFEFKELIIRLRHVRERVDFLTSNACAEIGLEDRVLHLDSYRVLHINDHRQVDLSQKECAVLKLLAQMRGRVVSRDQIIHYAWGPSEFPSTRTVDNFIVTIRKKIEKDPRHPRHLRSVRGAGYLLEWESFL